jgi:DNA-directed RNA polymerase
VDGEADRLQPQLDGDGHGQLFQSRTAIMDALRADPQRDQRSLMSLSLLLRDGRLKQAKALLEDHKHQVTAEHYGLMIRRCYELGQWESGEGLFWSMQQIGLTPPIGCFALALCGRALRDDAGTRVADAKGAVLAAAYTNGDADGDSDGDGNGDIFESLRAAGHHPSELQQVRGLTAEQASTVATIVERYGRLGAPHVSAAAAVELPPDTLEQWQLELGLEVELEIPGAVAAEAEALAAEVEASMRRGRLGALGCADSGSTSSTSASASYTMAAFRPTLIQTLVEARAEFKRRQKRRKTPAEPGCDSFLFSLSNEELADIVLPVLDRELRGHDKGALLHVAVNQVGCAVNRRFFLNEHEDRLADLVRTTYTSYVKAVAERKAASKATGSTADRRTLRELWEDTLEEQRSQLTPNQAEGAVSDEWVEWPLTTIKQVGIRLIDLVVSVANMKDFRPATAVAEAAEVETPSTGHPNETGGIEQGVDDMNVEALYHTYDFVGSSKVSLIRCHPVLEKRLAKESGSDSGSEGTTKTISATSLPMLTMPKPWAGLRTTPYLALPQSLVRCGPDAYQHLAILSKEEHGMAEVYDALNTLGATPWTINGKVLDVMSPLFTSGKAWPHLDVPPADVAVPERSRWPELPAAERYEKHQERTAAVKERNENAGLRAEFVTRVAIAHKFRGRTFYLPHNLDFRGRAYVMPPHLSHLGCDGARALLLFADRKVLGPRGLFWLKVHVANLFGVDKVSFEDRVAFTEENVDRIHACADTPWTDGDGIGWWEESENPWQTLAVCIELSAALRSPDPEKYESCLPVHQDGTCNGLQHYAALGGDVEGARAVNLCPVPGDDKPQDVYMAVVDRVNAMILRHAAGDFSAGKHPGDSLKSLNSDTVVTDLAQKVIADGPIARKTVKQTIMTSVYGVTFIGGRDQVYKQIKNNSTMDKKTKNLAAGYLVSCVFSCLDEMFGGAHALKEWLAESAGEIACSGAPVTWVTPMGMPVVQPYHKPVENRVQAGEHKLFVTNSSDVTLPPNPTKQKSAFPPNYVHSLDSTHMMYTANACAKEDVTFVAVHDSYWTHANTVDAMNVHCREQFVRLHSQPLLSRLGDYFSLYFDGAPHLSDATKCVVIKPPPERGDFDLNEVLRSKYFFN